MAQQFLEQSEAGQAERCALRAMNLARDCRALAEADPSWRAVVEYEHSLAAEMQQKSERERCNVSFQKIPPTAPAIAEGKVLVKPIAYAGVQAVNDIAAKSTVP